MRAFERAKSADVASDILGVDPESAVKILHSFASAGYIESENRASQEGPTLWIATIRGNALAQASFGKPITRVTADRLLAEVIERTRNYNADPSRLLTVAELKVFGSYLESATDRLGDLDLVISIMHRETDGERYVDKARAYAEASGRNFPMYQDKLFWPHRELLMILKNRSHAISFTDEDISGFTDKFQVVYRVQDDPEAIQQP